MLSLPNYTTLSTVYDGERHLVFRARRNLDNLPVMIKLLKIEHPHEKDIARISWEYEAITKIQSPFVVRAYAVESYRNMMFIVLGDFGGLPLSKWMTKGIIPLEDFLRLALNITGGLEQIHEKGIVHRDINPSNIVCNPETGETRIIDFDSSSQAYSKAPPWSDKDMPEGPLTYISPEQTGRMNRTTDHRSDLYSLGVTFYQILAGRLPFQTQDPMELIYSHIAVNPQPLHEVNPGIPEALSDIVQKLMAKDPDDRYNSATGIKRDLARCLSDFAKSGRIDKFVPGQHCAIVSDSQNSHSGKITALFPMNSLLSFSRACFLPAYSGEIWVAGEVSAVPAHARPSPSNLIPGSKLLFPRNQYFNRLQVLIQNGYIGIITGPDLSLFLSQPHGFGRRRRSHIDRVRNRHIAHSNNIPHRLIKRQGTSGQGTVFQAGPPVMDAYLLPPEHVASLR